MIKVLDPVFYGLSYVKIWLHLLHSAINYLTTKFLANFFQIAANSSFVRINFI
jgi:predicted membrane protein